MTSENGNTHGLSPAQREAITRHVQEHVGPIEVVLHELVAEQITVDVLVVRPTPDRPWFTLVTCGMSTLPMNVPQDIPEAAAYEFAELVIALPQDWPMSTESDQMRQDLQDSNVFWPIQLLRTLARMPHVNRSWLFFGHTVGAEDAPSYAPDTELSSAIIATPVMTPEEFQELEVEGRTIHFLSVIPLYQLELNLARERGSSFALECLLEEQITELLDPQRPPFSY